LNTADAVFTAAASREDFAAGRDALVNHRVNDKLIDCSDAHTWSASSEKDRLGNCFTWINADPTFKGLRHALREYDHRVTVVRRPAVLNRVATKPETVIDAISIQRAAGFLGSPALFDSGVPLNPGFTVVLGNKGQGKSALLDIIAATANSDRREDFSFLKDTRFLRNKGREARQYEAALDWCDGTSRSISLDQPFEPSQPIRVDYLPQSLIERVCSADPDSVEKRQFEREIEQVVFRHVPVSDRADSVSLRDFVNRQSKYPKTKLAAARGRLQAAATALTDLESAQEHLLTLNLDGRLSAIQEQIGAIEAQIGILKNSIDERHRTAGTVTETLSARHDDAVRRRDAVLAEIQQTTRQVTESTTRLRSAVELRLRLAEAMAVADRNARELAEILGADHATFFQMSNAEDIVDRLVRDIDDQQRTRQKHLVDPVTGLATRADRARLEILEIEQKLQEQAVGTEADLASFADLEKRRLHLIGDPGNVDSMLGLQALMAHRDSIPEQRTSARGQLEAAFREVHNASMAIFAVQRNAFAGATEFVADSELCRQVGLEFGVELRARDFLTSWVEMVNKQRLSEYPEVADAGDRDVLLARVSGIS
jgi:hypothetical protein